MSVVRKVKPFLSAALLCAIVIAGALAWHGGYRIYVVHTGSMAPTLMAGDAVLDGPARATYQPGDIITFRHSGLATDLVTHSVVDVTAGKIHTKGDANRTADVWDIHPDQVQGVVIRRFPHMGFLVIFLRQPAGVAALILGGLAVVLVRRLRSPQAKPETDPESAHSQAPSTSPTRRGAAGPTAPRAPGPPGQGKVG